MDFILYFLIGSAFGYLVLPAVVLWRKKQKEFVLHNSADSPKEAKDNAIRQLVAQIQELKAVEVKAIAVSVFNYDETHSFVGLGGTIGDIDTSIEVLVKQFAKNVSEIEESYTKNGG